MSKLQPLEDTVVHLRTQAEYDEYMQLAEEAGWKWVNGSSPTHSKTDKWWYGFPMWIDVKPDFMSDREPLEGNPTVIGLSKLKAKFGIGTKPKPEPWKAHYTKSGHTLSADKIKLASGKEYTPAELQAELNMLRSIQTAHKKYFPSAK